MAQGVIIATGAWAAIILACLYLFFKIWFERDPERHAPKGRNLVISPADGRIIALKRLDNKSQSLRIKKGLLGSVSTRLEGHERPELLISIFMTPFDVHVQRSPLKGVVVRLKHTKGAFNPANSLKNAFTNEKSETGISTEFGTVRVIQIAGLVARRIITFTRKGQPVQKGQRIGKITLGSQVALLLPPGARPLIKKGQRVLAGLTPLAIMEKNKKKGKG